MGKISKINPVRGNQSQADKDQTDIGSPTLNFERWTRNQKNNLIANPENAPDPTIQNIVAEPSQAFTMAKMDNMVAHYLAK